MPEVDCINYISKELIFAIYDLKQAHRRKDAAAVEKFRKKVDILTEISKRLGGAYDKEGIR